MISRTSLPSSSVAAGTRTVAAAWARATAEPPIRQGVFLPKRETGGCDAISVLGDSPVRADEGVVRSLRNQARPAITCGGGVCVLASPLLFLSRRLEYTDPPHDRVDGDRRDDNVAQRNPPSSSVNG